MDKNRNTFEIDTQNLKWLAIENHMARGHVPVIEKIEVTDEIGHLPDIRVTVKFKAK
jgi:hypothetical protein